MFFFYIDYLKKALIFHKILLESLYNMRRMSYVRHKNERHFPYETHNMWCTSHMKRDTSLGRNIQYQKHAWVKYSKYRFLSLSFSRNLLMELRMRLYSILCRDQGNSWVLIQYIFNPGKVFFYFESTFIERHVFLCQKWHLIILDFLTSQTVFFSF